MNNQQISLSIIAAQDGGIVVYEGVDDDNILAFAGNLEEASRYLSTRMSRIIVTGERKDQPARLLRVDELEAAE